MSVPGPGDGVQSAQEWGDDVRRPADHRARWIMVGLGAGAGGGPREGAGACAHSKHFGLPCSSEQLLKDRSKLET